jgi:sodium transport system permease protein
MGSALQSLFTVDEEYQPQIYALNVPAPTPPVTFDAAMEFIEIEPGQVDAVKEQITEKEADALVVFSEDFTAAVLEKRSLASGGEGALGSEASLAGSGLSLADPTVSIYYNSTKPESSAAYSTLLAALDTLMVQLQPELFAINPEGDLDLATEQDSTGLIFSALLPFLVMIMLFTGAMGLATESIAGEKERGTFATMLVTPLRRWELACGKIVSISIIALLSGISSFVGIALSLPQMVDIQSSGISAALYGSSDYVFLLAITLSTVLLFVGLISLFSALAKSVKEASTFVTPLMIIVMLVGAMGLFSTGAQADFWFYLIPVYNSVQAMIGIFSFAYEPVFALLTIVVNLVCTGICVGILTWMFGNERIMFAR